MAAWTHTVDPALDFEADQLGVSRLRTYTRPARSDFGVPSLYGVAQTATALCDVPLAGYRPSVHRYGAHLAKCNAMGARARPRLIGAKAGTGEPVDSLPTVRTDHERR